MKFDRSQMIFLDPESADRMHMRVQERNLRITRFMDELKPDDAYTFYELLGLISNSQNPSDVANFLEGQMYAIVRVVHKLCPGCGQDHDGADHAAWEESNRKDETDDEIDPGTGEL